MKICHWQRTIFCVAFLAVHVSAATYYVDLNCTNPVPPFTDWSTAATNIQDAVNASTNGDLILVTNGVYQTGQTADSGNCRVVINDAVTVESVNGPAATVIAGYQVPGTTNGSAAVRCVALGNNATLIGFTLTNGATPSVEAYGGGVLCLSTTAVLSNCVLVGNSAYYGGGAALGTLDDCILSNNVALDSGGGSYESTLNNCLLTGNSASSGGAVASEQANNTTILNNCTIYGNSASESGGGFTCAGGIANAYLYATNCIIFGNTAPTGPNYYGFGGFAFFCCCTAPLPAGIGNFTNNPDFVNAAAGDFHLQSNSPCINAGPTWAVSATDLDGNPRIVGGFVDIGAYEYQLLEPPAVIPSFQATYMGVSTGIVVSFTGQVSGYPTASSWNFGDGTVLSNQLPTVSHSWTAPGDYDVTLTGYSAGYPAGVTASVVIHVLINPTHYVSQNGTNPVAPYFTWATAATNIQDAVDAAYVGGTVVVSNGVYAYGGDVDYGQEGSVMNRVYVTKPISLVSVNGPAVTAILGNPGNVSVRCVYLSEGDSLAGFTLTNGLTATNDNLANDISVQSGGGVYSTADDAMISNCVFTANSAYYIGGAADGGTLINCLITNNSAYAGGAGIATMESCLIISNSAGIGGGPYGGTISDCIIIGNTATYDGGGAYWSTLDNCTVANNSAAESGGGVFGATINNCIVYDNYSPDGPNYLTDSFTGYGAYNYSCTTPLPASGPGNITNDPAFNNLANDDFHLQPNSPCINSGNNAFVLVPADFDGNPRIVGGTVDMGAYEFQTPVSMTSYAWLQEYGLPVTTNTDSSSPNGTGFTIYQDWIAGLNPTNPASVLAMNTPLATNNAAGIAVSWQSVSGISYMLQRSTNLSSAFVTLQSGIPGQAGTTSYSDTTATNNVPYYYRVGAY